jgi:hypothetical protein
VSKVPRATSKDLHEEDREGNTNAFIEDNFDF